MIFTKEELNFLDMYSLTTENKKDNRRDIYGKIIVKADKEKQVVTFTQFSSDIQLYTEVNKQVSEDLYLILPTIQFCNLIKLVPDSSDIKFNDEGIEFNENKYSFDKEEIEFQDISIYVDAYKQSTNVLCIDDLSKFSNLKTYVGNYENNLDAINCTNGYFVAKNSDVFASIKTSNKKELFYFFSKVLINVLSSLKQDKVEFKKWKMSDDNTIVYDFNKEEDEKTEDDWSYYSACKIKDTYIISTDKEYLIQNLFEEKFIEMYDHKNSIKVDKQSFLDSLSRIKLFTNVNLGNRVFIECVDSENILIKTDTNAVEKLHAEVDKTLIGQKRIIPSFVLFQVSADLEGKQVVLFTDEDGSSPVAKIEDESNTNFYIVRVFEDED